MAIATVSYMNGAGNADNRQIAFIRTGNPPTLKARFSVIGTHNVWADIDASQINVEMESTTHKMQKMIAERNGQVAATIPDQPLSSFTPNIQDRIVQSINPNSQIKGGRWIEVVNHAGEASHTLTIIDPR